MKYMEKIQTNGFQEPYKIDQGFALYMRMTAAFSSPNSVANVFERMSDIIRNNCGIAADEVLDHFEDMYFDWFCRN